MSNIKILSGGLRPGQRPPPSRMEDFTTSAIGFPFRFAAGIGGVPKAIGQVVESLGSSLDKILPGLHPSVEKEFGGDSFGHNIVEALPSAQGITKNILEPTIGRLLPEGALSGTGDIEQWIDPIASIAILSALTGGAGAAMSLPSLLGKAVRTVPLAIATTAVGKGAEDLKLPAWANLAAQVATMSAGPAAWRGIKNIGSKFPGASEQAAVNLFKKRFPLGKEIVGELSEEEASIAAKARQEQLAESRISQEAEKSRLREHQQIQRDLERHNREQINELTRSDVARQQERNRLIKAVDKYSHENIDILSRSDAKSLKDKIYRGEAVDIPEGIKTAELESMQSFSGYDKVLKDLGASEAAIIEKFGGKPGVLSQRATNLYNDFYDSIPKDKEYISAKEFTDFKTWAEKEMSRGAPVTRDVLFLRDLISDFDKKIVNGKIKIEDVAASRMRINSKMRSQRASVGSLEPFEKLAYKYIDRIDKTLEQAANESPGLKLDAYKEGLRISRDLNEAGKIVTWLDDVVESKLKQNRVPSVSRLMRESLGSFAKLRRSKEMRKYFGNMLVGAAKKEVGKAVNNATKLATSLDRYQKQEGSSVFGSPSAITILKGGLKKSIA